MKELSEIEIVESVQRGLVERAQIFTGTGIFAPTFKELAKVAGIPISHLYFRSRPKDKLAAATGKQVVSERPYGYLLGDPRDIRPLEATDLPPARTSVGLEDLAARVNSLNDEDRQELARRIAE